MVNWREAINRGLRRTTGYHLTRHEPDSDAAAAAARLDAAAAYAGYCVDHLDDTSLLLSPQTPTGPRMELEALDDTTWIVRRTGGRRRTAVQIGSEALRTHLVLDLRATRSNNPVVQRQLGGFLAHEQVSTVLRTLDINVVLDVGANVGQYATRLRAHGYQGRIVSFEPVPELAARLRERAQADDDWLVLECALGEEEGTSELHAAEGTLSSLLEPSEFGREWSRQLRDARTQTIQVARLDSLWDQITTGIDSPRVYMKLDTQGFDLQAFRGAGTRIEDVSAFQSEVSCIPIYEGMARLPESLAVYEGAGFEIAGMYPVTFHRRTLRVIEFDMIMVRADAAQQAAADGTEGAAEEAGVVAER